MTFFICGLLTSASAQNYKLRVQVNLLPELAHTFNKKEIRIFTFDSLGGTNLLKIPGEIIIDSIAKDSVMLLLSSHWKFNSYKKEFILFTGKIKLIKDSVTSIYLTFPEECAYNKHAVNKVCPKCKKSDKVISILYGHRTPMFDKYGNILDPDPKEFHLGMDYQTNCSPSWYCKRDKLSF